MTDVKGRTVAIIPADRTLGSSDGLSPPVWPGWSALHATSLITS